MANTVQAISEEDLAPRRSLKEFADLINEALREAEIAGKQYLQRVGELLVDVCDQHFDGDRSKAFWDWVKRNIKDTGVIQIERQQTERYMEQAIQNQNRARLGKKPFETTTQSDRARGWKPRGEQTPKRDYHEPVEEILEKVNTERLAAERTTRAAELDEIRKLARQIVDIGFRALASRLHPDKRGGSRRAMQLLNQARDRLRRAI